MGHDISLLVRWNITKIKWGRADCGEYNNEFDGSSGLYGRAYGFWFVSGDEGKEYI